MSRKNNPYFTRSQAARVNRNMEDDVAPEDSISQASIGTPVSSSHSSHSRSSRSKEQLEMDISTLAIKMQSQQRRAQLEKEKLDVEKEKLDVEKKKLDIELELEKNNLQEEMDLAKNERESLDGESSDVMQTPEQIKNPVNEEIQKMLKDCYTFIDDCCAHLGSGKVDLNGKKACRVYMSPDKNPNPNKTDTRENAQVQVSTYKYSKKGDKAYINISSE